MAQRGWFVVGLIVAARLPLGAVAQTAPTPDTIVFSPAVPTLDNPSDPADSGTATTLHLGVTAYDAAGNPLAPSASNPLYIQIYGAPPGAIAPTALKLTGGTSAKIKYTGAFVPGNLTVEAWIFDANAGIPAGEPGAVAGGYAIGVTQIAPQNRLPCNDGGESFALNATAAPPQQFVIDAAVGFADPADAASNYAGYTVDTGSMGLLMPLLALPRGKPKPTATAPVIGPGPAGVQYYDSSGNTFSGYYYLAPVTFATADGGAVQTVPIEVLAVNKAFCMGPQTKSCWKNPPANPPRLHYMGVGFDRESLVSGSLFQSPAQNAFLNIKSNSAVLGITQGYILSQHAPNITLGLTRPATRRFAGRMVTLAPNDTLPGEWSAIPGCFSFPELGHKEFCGNMLLDVGIDEMFLGVDPSLRPPRATKTASDGDIFVPRRTKMAVTVGGGRTPGLAYEFNMPSFGPPSTPTTERPTYAEWVAPPASGGVFFNTGIAPLLHADYLYNAQCGRVGFADQQP